MSIAHSIVATLALLLATPSFAQDEDTNGQTAMPTKGLLWGSKMTIEAQACCTQAGGGKSPDRGEAAVMAKLAGHVSRDDTILRLGLEGGRSLKITDCSDETACEADRFRTHRLVAWWPESRLYVVNVALYEASQAYMISEKDGRTTQVVAPPVISPSGRHAVALLANQMAGMILDLVDPTVSPPKVTEIKTLPTCKGFGPDSFLRPNPVWVDDSHVRFDGVSAQPGDDPGNKQLLHIEGSKTSWEC